MQICRLDCGRLNLLPSPLHLPSTAAPLQHLLHKFTCSSHFITKPEPHPSSDTPSCQQKFIMPLQIVAQHSQHTEHTVIQIDDTPPSSRSTPVVAAPNNVKPRPALLWPKQFHESVVIQTRGDAPSSPICREDGSWEPDDSSLAYTDDEENLTPLTPIIQRLKSPAPKKRRRGPQFLVPSVSTLTGMVSSAGEINPPAGKQQRLLRYDYPVLLSNSC